MGTKQKYFRRRGKRGVIYLAERHCGVLLSDCLHTTDERIAELRRREIHISVERGEYRAGKVSFEQAVKESFDALVDGKAESTRRNYESSFRIHLVPWFGKARLTQIDTAELVQYKRAREAKGAGEGLLKQELWLARWVLKRYGRKVEPCREPYKKPHKPVDRFPAPGGA